MPSPPAGHAAITALLGPTNTGKTHRAVERMLQHESGIIGLPLRLLAREVYDRVSARLGEGAVALVTGEEKRLPPGARYWVCTVEAMPDREADFLAVDEVQLAGHPERGHVFTDRLLRSRGRRETWFLGADTMRPLMSQLVPTAHVESRPRLSTLSGAGSIALTALPPRTAVVAFSAARVYELAERLRARRGGAAVVLGALSPRARNAQVAMYQAGEVDYLVATDAIGMGLNMDVDCVAFADLRKFDGKQARALDDAELAQIAGRAGRHHNDGRFATLAPLPALSQSVTRAIERHRFPSLRRLYWRNADIEQASVDALIESLRRPPPASCLELTDDAEDMNGLLRLRGDEEVMARARGQQAVALLWQVCQIPDFRQLQLDDHFQLLRAVYLQLTSGRGRLDPDWIRRHVERLDDMQGDMETLLARMAFVRTWTYITQHARWVDDATAWRERTRAIEDRLSDALHESLVRRFVAEGGRRSGRVRTVKHGTLAQQLLHAVPEIDVAPAGRDERWVDELCAAPHDAFAVDDGGRIQAADRVLGRLVTGMDRLHPEVTLADGDLGAGARLRLHRRLVAWSRDLVSALLAPLREHSAALSPAARGVAYQLEEGLGTAWMRVLLHQPEQLTAEDREALRRIGVRFGRHLVWVQALLRPAAVRIRVSLCRAHLGPGTRLPVPRPDAVSLTPDPDLPAQLYTALGFPVFGARAIRADVAEAAAGRLRHGAPARELCARLGCVPDELPAIADALGPGGRRRSG